MVRAGERGDSGASARWIGSEFASLIHAERSRRLSWELRVSFLEVNAADESLVGGCIHRFAPAVAFALMRNSHEQGISFVGGREIKANECAPNAFARLTIVEIAEVRVSLDSLCEEISQGALAFMEV